MTPITVKNATCTFCGCVCDHIDLEAQGDRIVKTKHACGLGETWFKNHTAKRLVPEGRKGRTMVLVDVRETPSVRYADIFLQVRPGKDFEMVTTLRALLKNRPVDEARVAETGLTLEQLRDFVERMKRARFGVLFF